MKIRRILSLMLVLALCAACAEEAPQYLYTEFVVERFLNQVPEYEFYVDHEDSPYASRVVFFAEAELINFRYLAVEALVSEDGELSVLENEVLFTLETFGPGKPLVIELEFPEILPLRAFAFETADGETHFCYPALSGESGTPILVPCIVETRDIPE